jgi:hypothetical protein
MGGAVDFQLLILPYRFDVVMRSAPQNFVPTLVKPLKKHCWSSQTSLDALVSAVVPSLPIILRGIPNARIADAHLVSASTLDGSQTLSKILDTARAHRESSVVCHPENLLRRLSEKHDWTALPLCSLNRPECFDVLVVNTDTPQADVERLCFEAQLAELRISQETQVFSNKQKTEISRETLRLLHEYLSRRVPPYVSKIVQSNYMRL